jgi:broad specificity phosphatase PhoE
VGAGSGFGGDAFHRGGQRLTFEEANVNVFVIRHGETAWSLSGQHTGTTDIPLTDNGRRLAERMRPVLAKTAFGLVLYSPMQRARETCKLAGFGDKAVLDSDLVEWNYGEYEGRTPKQIHEVAPGLADLPRRMPRRRDA